MVCYSDSWDPMERNEEEEEEGEEEEDYPTRFLLPQSPPINMNQLSNARSCMGYARNRSFHENIFVISFALSFQGRGGGEQWSIVSL